MKTIRAHVMKLVSSNGDVNEFLCPICGRHIFLNLIEYHKTIDVEGDTSVPHSGSLSDDIISLDTLKVTLSTE